MNRIAAILPLVVLLAHAHAQANDAALKLNQIQVIGSHNSYHAGFAPSERKYLEMKNPKELRGLDYHHPPLGEQLSAGIRQVEIDIGIALVKPRQPLGQPIGRNRLAGRDDQ